MDNYEYRKEMYENFIKKNYDNESNQTINLPYNWRLEDNKFSFRMMIRIFNLSNGSKSVCIDIDQINYNNNNEDDIFNTDILFHEIFPPNTEKNKIIHIISEFLTNFRVNYTFSKILDKLILKKNIVEEDKLNLFLFVEADPYKETFCCVCNETSLTFTICKHNLCRICFSSIEIENEYDQNYWKKCPLCRKKLNLIPI